MIAQTLRFGTIPGAWRGPGIALLAVIALLLGAYQQTVESMVSIWLRSETFAHAFVVPPLVLWLVWRKRDELSPMMPRPTAWALLPIAVAAMGWLLARLALVHSVEQLAFTSLLVLAVPLVLGRQVAQTLLFPLCFLFFAVPVGEFMVPTLMQWTADFTVTALRLSGIPVYREGLQFVIPTGRWSVVEACSGIRYLVASFMVGSLFAYLNYRSTKRRMMFVGLSLLVPVVANWLRAYLTVMLGHLSGNKLAVGFDHLIYGWLFFGIVITALFVIGARWAQTPAPVPVQARSGLRPEPVTLRAFWPLALLVAVLLPPLLLSLAAQQRTSAAPSLQLPDRLAADWRATDEALSAWMPNTQRASVQARRSYRKAGLVVDVHIAYFRDQDEDHKLVSSSNTLVPSQDPHWQQISRGVASAPDAAGGFEVASAEIGGAARFHQARRLQVWHWYWIGGGVTHREVVAKLLSGWQRLTGHDDESALVVLCARQDSEGGGKTALESFVRDNWPLLDQQLRETSHRR